MNTALPDAQRHGQRALRAGALVVIGWTLGLGACSASPSPRAEAPARTSSAPSALAVPASTVPISSATAPTAAPQPTAKTQPPPAFCQESVAEHARPHLGGLEALGPAEALGAEAAKTAGAWTWINLWATWCGPCVHELPRLMAWQQGKLGVPFRLVLVSLDEDRAEVERFLAEEMAPEPDGQPGAAAHLQGVYWLPMSARPTFFGTLGLPAMGMLPVQVLVDPQGHVRCAHGGAVHSFHQAAAAAILKGATTSAPTHSRPTAGDR